MPLADGWAVSRRRFRMRHRPARFGRRLILAQTFLDDLAQQIVIGPGQELDLGHQLGPHPMHAAEDQG
jgi:hypothetical protein